MTEHDIQRFAVAFGALIETFRAQPTDVLAESYRVALEDLPISEIEQAVILACRQHEKFLPTPAELRRYLAAEKRVHLRQVAGRFRRHETNCPTCCDSGWITHQCAPSQRCERPFCARENAPVHEYVVPCLCRATNRNYQAKQAYDALAHDAQSLAESVVTQLEHPLLEGERQ